MHYVTKMGDVHAVDDVTFSLEPGEAIGLVGEPSCGKTSIALALLRLLPDNAKFLGGQVLFEGADLARPPERGMRRIRRQGSP